MTCLKSNAAMRPQQAPLIKLCKEKRENEHRTSCLGADCAVPARAAPRTFLDCPAGGFRFRHNIGIFHPVRNSQPAGGPNQLERSDTESRRVNCSRRLS